MSWLSKILGSPWRKVTERLFPQFFAWLDFRRGRRRGRPLNGQGGRAAIVAEIISACGIALIVETGTFRAATAKWFARFGVPVRTVEVNARNVHFSRLVLAEEPLVRLAPMDSVAFLEALAEDQAATSQTTLFYLDAHWQKRLPLGDEIRIVARAFPQAVMVIDDFEVPDDPDYSFDNYGPDKRLDLSYVGRTGVTGLRAFFPVLRGSDEDGARRGCVVLTASDALAGKLGAMPLLRAYPLAGQAGSAQAAAATSLR